jgi:hypothetical protein
VDPLSRLTPGCLVRTTTNKSLQLYFRQHLPIAASVSLYRLADLATAGKQRSLTELGELAKR